MEAHLQKYQYVPQAEAVINLDHENRTNADDLEDDGPREVPYEVQSLIAEYDDCQKALELAQE